MAHLKQTLTSKQIRRMTLREVNEFYDRQYVASLRGAALRAYHMAAAREADDALLALQRRAWNERRASDYAEMERLGAAYFEHMAAAAKVRV